MLLVVMEEHLRILHPNKKPVSLLRLHTVIEVIGHSPVTIKTCYHDTAQQKHEHSKYFVQSANIRNLDKKSEINVIVFQPVFMHGFIIWR